MTTNNPNFAILNGPAGKEENPAILKDKNGNDVALEGVKVRGSLQGLMA
ncbi:MAG: hypothetical protein Q7U78_09370 [Gallionella sp.]|nr:hypothetical protein [Gallionella sp.]